MIIYLIAVSAVALVLTVYDKIVSQKKTKRRVRVPEALLMLTGAAGGATVMYITMQIIRHKTKHKKFMVGLPVFIVLHLIAILVFFYL